MEDCNNQNSEIIITSCKEVDYDAIINGLDT